MPHAVAGTGEFRVSWSGTPPPDACSVADLSEPRGTLDHDDFAVFLAGFVTSFVDGCP